MVYYRVLLFAAPMSTMEPLSVLIPDGEHDTSYKVVTCLSQIPKIRIHVISTAASTRTRYSRFCSSFALRRGTSEEDWFNQIRDVVTRKNVNVILPVSEPGTRFACVRRESLLEFAALPLLPELRSFDIARDKGSLAQFLYEHNLPLPKTKPALHTFDDPATTFPALIKPRHSYGGLGIKRVADRKALEDFLQANRDRLDKYIVQEFVPGYDLGCNALCKDGEILAHIIHKPVESRAQFGRSLHLELVHCPETLLTTKKLIAAFRWSGLANIDLRYNERAKRIEILEFNPRFWGVLISSLQGGINFPYLCCLTALRLPLPQAHYRAQQYMEVRHALLTIARKLTGGSGKVPDLMRETNLPFILRDPLPFVNRFIRRSQPYSEIAVH